MARPRARLLVTFDAFNTLIYPRRPIIEQYTQVAHSFGHFVRPKNLKLAFHTAFITQNAKYPNYGHEGVLQGRYGGPRQWWTEMIQDTFARCLPRLEKLPDGMVERLLHLFSTPHAYSLCEGVVPMFRKLKELKRHFLFDRIIVGVISNSDDRIPLVLKALSLKVGDCRADEGRSSEVLPGFEELPSNRRFLENPDIDMVITSYEAGRGKPDKLIFDVAMRQAKMLTANEGDADHWFKIHIGDDYKKDYLGAINAGWESLFLLPTKECISEKVKTISTLTEVIPEIERIASRIANPP